MVDGPIPEGLPPALSVQQLVWLTGLTAQRINQLAAQGVVVKIGRDQYALSSIRRMYEQQRERGSGPRKWNDARVSLTTERAAMARLLRLERERELLPAAAVTEMGVAIVTICRDKFLGLPVKMAHRLASESKPAEVERQLYNEVYEILTELAELANVAETLASRDNGNGRRKGAGETRD